VDRFAKLRRVAASMAFLFVVAGAISANPESPSSGASPPKPLTILVTDDHGYNAPGINTMVQALRKLPRVIVKVVAPATNESGSGCKTTAGTLVVPRPRH
jgi:5'-nucleotidase